MITLQEVTTALRRAAHGTTVVSEMPHPPPFLAGYDAALDDLHTFLDNTGPYWQRLLPAAVLPPPAALRERFDQRYGAALRGGDP